jgi:hypothetical protein
MAGEGAVASQRIVLTSPWKLGLFVFLLVVGTGFGLIYSYLTLFHGDLDFQDPETVKTFYMVIGGVAVLGLLGYLATVTSARPLDRVVRGGKQQQKLMKALARIQDPRDVDPQEFEGISELEQVVGRWQDEANSAHDARVEGAGLREKVAELERELDDLRRSTADEEAAAETVAAIAATAVDRTALRQATRTLKSKHRELGNFVESIGDCAADLSQRATPGASSGGDLGAILHRNGERISAVRTQLDELAEEANKLAITAALQVSRIGDGAEEILGTAEQMRSLSTRFQRVAGDLRVCEADQAAAAQHGGGGGGAPHGLDAIVMVLDQATEGLSEVLTQIAGEITELERWASDDSKADSASAPAQPSAPAAPAAQPSAPAAPAAQPSAPAEFAMASAPQSPVEDGESAEVFDIVDLGGVALEMDQDDGDDGVYDLGQFGAVEL